MIVVHYCILFVLNVFVLNAYLPIPSPDADIFGEIVNLGKVKLMNMYLLLH